MQQDRLIQSIYLYDRSALAISSSNHKEMVLFPMELYTEVLESNSKFLSSDLESVTALLKDAYVTPLLRALPDYNKHFWLKLDE